ncbi:helix-turn-helix domain-containing protein [Glutamicibacter soli]
MPQNDKLLAQSIRHRRIELGYSQEELSEQLGISRKQISSMENGRFGTLAILGEVLEALGLELMAAPRELRETRVLKNELLTRTAGLAASRVKRQQP